ncbi:MAG: hypothetical protein WA791_20755, partial [Rhodomicrobium sp.]
ILGLAVVLILTKPTPQYIVSAAAGSMNYIVINKDKIPRSFETAAATAAVIQTVEDVFAIGGRNPDAAVKWRMSDLIFLMYSDLTLAGTGSLKCVWLLRNGFCSYFSR